MDTELLDQSLSFHGSALMQQLMEEHGEALSLPAVVRRRFSASDSPVKDRWMAEDKRYIQLFLFLCFCFVGGLFLLNIFCCCCKYTNKAFAFVSLCYSYWGFFFYYLQGLYRSWKTGNMMEFEIINTNTGKSHCI